MIKSPKAEPKCWYDKKNVTSEQNIYLKRLVFYLDTYRETWELGRCAGSKRSWSRYRWLLAEECLRICSRQRWEWTVSQQQLCGIGKWDQSWYLCVTNNNNLKRSKQAHLQLKHLMGTVVSRLCTAATWEFSTLYWNSPACKMDTWKWSIMLDLARKHKVRCYLSTNTSLHCYQSIVTMWPE